MNWHYAAGSYTLQHGECSLRAWLHPDMPPQPDEGDLGSDEHPFVWFFEVCGANGRREFRGVRETLAEAQWAALQKVREVESDVLRAA